MTGAVAAVIALLMLAALVPGVLTLLAAVLAMVALLGVLLLVMRRRLADETAELRPRPPTFRPAEAGKVVTEAVEHT